MKNEHGVFKKYKYSEIKDKIEKPNINNPVEPYKI